MAADNWIKWTVGLAAKREVRIIASRLHRDRHEIAGRLMVLWEWLGDNLSAEAFDPETEDAHLEMGEDWQTQIDEIAGLPGFAEVLASTAICWISARSGGRVTFPNLGRHNGKNAKIRAMEAKKKARQRRDKCPADVPMASALEKRREDIVQTHNSASAGDADESMLPTEAEALAQCAPAGIPPDFGAYAFAQWSSQSGKNANGVPVPWIRYARKRWVTEGNEWTNGTHKGKRKSKQPTPNHSDEGSFGF